LRTLLQRTSTPVEESARMPERVLSIRFSSMMTPSLPGVADREIADRHVARTLDPHPLAAARPEVEVLDRPVGDVAQHEAGSGRVADGTAALFGTGGRSGPGREERETGERA
jgi:hypothetical protein